MESKTDNSSDQPRLFNLRNIIVFVVILIGLIVILTRSNGDGRRAPSPTPIYEGVDKIAP
jgi:hypothetical protein